LFSLSVCPNFTVMCTVVCLCSQLLVHFLVFLSLFLCSCLSMFFKVLYYSTVLTFFQSISTSVYPYLSLHCHINYNDYHQCWWFVINKATNIAQTMR
jgi:hypothetical protein